MKRKKKAETSGRNDRLEEAMALLIQNQASFVAQLRVTDREIAELRRATDEKFAQIVAILNEHGRILLRLVDVLPEAVKDKIGIKPEEK